MRQFTQAQKDLLRAASLKLNVLMTFWLDQGTYRFCDDIMNKFDGTYTWIGAQPLAAGVEIRSGRDLSAEPITLILDGNRMTQAGIQDPARVLRDIMGYLHQQRRVDIAFGFGYPEQQQINMVMPMAALKINYCRLIDEQADISNPNQEVIAKLEIVLDSLAGRYSRAPYRTRCHADQLQLDPTDNFFSYVTGAVANERRLYWGKKSTAAGGSGSYSGGGYGTSGGSPIDSGGGYNMNLAT